MRRQINMSQRKEKDKTPEKEINEIEVSRVQNIDYKDAQRM